MSCRKFLIFPDHDYGKWETTAKGNLTFGNDTYGEYIIQERECKECGYVQRKISKIQ